MFFSPKRKQIVFEGMGSQELRNVQKNIKTQHQYSRFSVSRKKAKRDRF